MIEPLTSNTQAILLLTAPLIAGRGEPSCDLLSLGEYNRLTRILREKQKQPADLIGPDAHELIELCAQPFGRARLDGLLGRGFLLSQAVERWNARAIWVISRADSRYPKRLKTRLKEDCSAFALWMRRHCLAGERRAGGRGFAACGRRTHQLHGNRGATQC